MPTRVQLRRTKGWRKPAGTIVVARPSKWGNPFKITNERDAAEAVAEYRTWVETQPELIEDAKRELAGRDLLCWCRPGAPCHADVLLEIANADTRS